MPDTFKSGDAVRVTLNGHTTDAVIFMASSNGKSLAIWCEDGWRTSVGMYIGMMPVFRGDDGQYRELANNEVVTVTRITLSHPKSS